MGNNHLVYYRKVRDINPNCEKNDRKIQRLHLFCQLNNHIIHNLSSKQLKNIQKKNLTWI